MTYNWGKGVPDGKTDGNPASPDSTLNVSKPQVLNGIGISDILRVATLSNNIKSPSKHHGGSLQGGRHRLSL